MGIEPTSSAWEAEVLPLNYTRQLMKFKTPVYSQVSRIGNSFYIKRFPSPLELYHWQEHL